MIKVLAVCPDCGDVELALRDVSVSGGHDDLDSVVFFDCPVCGAAVARAVTAEAVNVLRRYGVRERSALPITEVEVHEFAVGLDSPSCLDELTSR